MSWKTIYTFGKEKRGILFNKKAGNTDNACVTLLGIAQKDIIYTDDTMVLSRDDFLPKIRSNRIVCFRIKNK